MGKGRDRGRGDTVIRRQKRCGKERQRKRRKRGGEGRQVDEI